MEKTEKNRKKEKKLSKNRRAKEHDLGSDFEVREKEGGKEGVHVGWWCVLAMESSLYLFEMWNEWVMNIWNEWNAMG